MISALVLQTQDDCQPGLLGDWSASRGVELDVLRVDRWPELPQPSNYSFAVLLGSDESFAGARSDWVLRVLDWIRSADAAGLPVLGIGFGAQALAAALGGSITRLATPELAWIELRVSDAEQVPAGPWLALHDETITLPPFARELARNEFGPQAFVIGPHLGVQFHPEVTPSILARWLADRGARVRADLLADARERCRAAAAGAFALFDSFARRAGEHAAEVRPRPRGGVRGERGRPCPLLK
jgi:GMP synthase-like glutamine amidotransferase